MTTTLQKTDLYTIKTHSSNTYTIEFNEFSQSFFLINSIIQTNLLKGGYTDDTYSCIYFKAESVKSFSEYQNSCKEKYGKRILSIYDAYHMIKSLTDQLNYLILKENMSFIGYHPSNIIVINDEIFIYMDYEKLLPLYNEEILLTSPFSTDDFFIAPELFHLKELPSYIHFKSCYFSLGCLILYSLLNDFEFYNNYIKSRDLDGIIENDIKRHPLYDTPVFSFLMKCLKKEPNSRYLICV